MTFTRNPILLRQRHSRTTLQSTDSTTDTPQSTLRQRRRERERERSDRVWVPRRSASTSSMSQSSPSKPSDTTVVTSFFLLPHFHFHFELSVTCTAHRLHHICSPTSLKFCAFLPFYTHHSSMQLSLFN